MAETIVYVNTHEVSCDGDTGEGPDHPLVYYTLKERRNGDVSASCFYCGKYFVYKEKLI